MPLKSLSPHAHSSTSPSTPSPGVLGCLLGSSAKKEWKIGAEVVKRLHWSSSWQICSEVKELLLLPVKKSPDVFQFTQASSAKCRLTLSNCTFAMVRTLSLQSPRHKIYTVKWEVRVLKWFKSLCSYSRILKGSSCLLCFWVLISMRELNHYIKTSKHECFVFIGTNQNDLTQKPWNISLFFFFSPMNNKISGCLW